MKAIVLVGGFGTRLQSVINDVPKPMAPIAEQPFLAYLLLYLKKRGITHVILSVHYKREQIVPYFGSEFHGIRVDYVVENEPLGTIGALAQITNFRHDYVLVTNSDLLTNVDFEHFFADAPALNPVREQVTGLICGIRVEEIADPLMREIRILDKLVDELAKGWPLAKVLRLV